MKIVISPAKYLNFEKTLPTAKHSEALFLKEARQSPRAGDENGNKNPLYLWVMVYPVLKNYAEPTEWTRGQDICAVLEQELL